MAFFRILTETKWTRLISCHLCTLQTLRLVSKGFIIIFIINSFTLCCSFIVVDDDQGRGLSMVCLAVADQSDACSEGSAAGQAQVACWD